MEGRRIEQTQQARAWARALPLRSALAARCFARFRTPAAWLPTCAVHQQARQHNRAAVKTRRMMISATRLARPAALAAPPYFTGRAPTPRRRRARRPSRARPGRWRPCPCLGRALPLKHRPSQAAPAAPRPCRKCAANFDKTRVILGGRAARVFQTPWGCRRDGLGRRALRRGYVAGGRGTATKDVHSPTLPPRMPDLNGPEHAKK